jgi:hypothetical protein
MDEGQKMVEINNSIDWNGKVLLSYRPLPV